MPISEAFMRWDTRSIKVFFGQEIFQTWVTKCANIGLELAALVGRSLYVCTQIRRDGKMCGMLAAMSPLMEQREKHKPFLCKECAHRELVERGSVHQASASA